MILKNLFYLQKRIFLTFNLFKIVFLSYRCGYRRNPKNTLLRTSSFQQLVNSIEKHSVHVRASVIACVRACVRACVLPAFSPTHPLRRRCVSGRNPLSGGLVGANVWPVCGWIFPGLDLETTQAESPLVKSPPHRSRPCTGKGWDVV